MLIGLHSGKTFECDDLSFTEFDKYTGEVTRIFTDAANNKKFTTSDSAIEFWEEPLSQEEFDALNTWGDEEEEDEDAVSVG